MQIDELVEFITPAAQATLGRIATAHPWFAGLCVVAAVVGLMLGLVSGYLKPEQLGTPRKRAGARLALRFGLAIKGSAADFKTLVTGIEETTAPAASDPLKVAAASLPPSPVPTSLVQRIRGREPALASPDIEPPRLPPVVSGARPPSRQPVPREEPLTVPPPAPGIRAPRSLRRLPTPPSALTETRLDVPSSRPPSRSRQDTPASPLSEDAIATPPEVPHSRPRSGQHAEAIRGRDRGRG